MTAALDPAAREPRDLTALSDTPLERFARHLSLDGFGPEASWRCCAPASSWSAPAASGRPC